MDTNLYGYVLGDPVNWVDSIGLAPYGTDIAGTILVISGPALGIALANPAVGAGIFIIGVGLIIWDGLTTPYEQMDSVQDDLESIEESIDEINEMLEEINNGEPCG